MSDVISRIYTKVSDQFNVINDFSNYVPLAQDYLPERAQPLAKRLGRIRGLPLGIVVVLLLGLVGLLSASHTGGPDIGGRASFDLSGPFDPIPFQELCELRRFTDGLYIQCMESSGDIAEVRNSVLLCTRYAIEMGGALVMPKMRVVTRDDSTGKSSGQLTSLNYLFDESYFSKTLATACPNLKIYGSVNDVPNIQELRTVPDLLDPHELDPTGLPIKHAFKIRVLVNRWINNQVKTYPSPETPVLVNFRRTSYQWPASQDSLDFWKEFGKILPFSTKYYKLAGRAMKSLSKSAGSASDNETLIDGRDLHFVGQYLNSELTGQSLPKVELNMQMSEAFQACSELGIRTIYVGTDTIEHAAAAMVAAEAHGLSVYTKWTLLDKSDSATLEVMNTDQQSVIDYLVLQQSTRFIGLTSSAISTSIATSRYAATMNGTVWSAYENGISVLKTDTSKTAKHDILLLSEWP